MENRNKNGTIRAEAIGKKGLNQKKRSVFIMNRRQLGFAMNQETSVLLQEFVIVSVTNWAHPM